MSSTGLTELSSLYWNPVTNRLYVSHGDGRLRVLQLNTSTNTFSQIGNVAYTAGPEGITQVNNSANTFYTIDEDSYQIRKYNHPANYSSVTLANSWNILAAPSPMINTGNTGPEGIAFISDSSLAAAGFVSQVTGTLYTSVKGMGGLIFIAHQDNGYIWVFDVNPNVNNDFAYVGKYKTNKTESCDLAFDKGTGLLYILHNTGSNTLEVTNLSSMMVGGERKFNVTNEYLISNPAGNINIEGFAITSKCSDSTNVSVWLCRDVESGESTTYKQDCLRWFQPFTAPGNCINTIPVVLNLKAFLQGFYIANRKMKPVLYDAGLSSDINACDSITVELRTSTQPFSIIESRKVLLKTDGSGSVAFPQVVLNNSYYIVVRHRNHLTTWSKNPILLNSTLMQLDFTQ